MASIRSQPQFDESAKASLPWRWITLPRSCELRLAEGKLFMVLAIDRVTKSTHVGFFGASTRHLIVGPFGHGASPGFVPYPPYARSSAGAANSNSSASAGRRMTAEGGFLFSGGGASPAASASLL